MSRRRLRIGTRGSKLALVQVDFTVQALLHAHPDLAGRVDIVTMTSGGDKNRKETLEAAGGRGIFTSDIDEALVNGDIDLAVHSVKDLPAESNEGVALTAMLPREDPREALVSQYHSSIDQLPQDAVIGSASHRRMAFLRHIKPDVKFALLRGNVEERVAAIHTPRYDGTILAVAGLKRLGLIHAIRQALSTDVFPPDPGQGAIGIACRSDDLSLRRWLSDINHQATFDAVTAERSMLAHLGEDYCASAGAIAHVSQGGRLTLDGTLIADDGSTMLRRSASGANASASGIGIAVAEQLIAALSGELAA